VTEHRQKGFLQSGHLPTLIGALLYFDVSFMVWVLLGPLAPFLREDLGLTSAEQGLLVAIPLLGGSLFRPILGAVADRLGGRRTAMVGMILTLLPLAIGWKFAHATAHVYALGFLLGIAGASFAVALPLASRWYPPEYQGLAMGIAGAGNSGSLLATLAAPRLAEHFGWANTFGLMMAPVACVLLVFALIARDSPQRSAPLGWRDYSALMKEPDSLWFCFLYSLTFGGFVGLTSFLTTFFHDQYGLSRVAAGDFTTIVVVAGSLLRPIGGWCADRIGGYRLLLVLLVTIGGGLAIASTLPPLAMIIPVLFVTMGLLGMGNGAVFQLVPQRFPDRIGTVTGLVGAAGGLGGFFLPSLLGAVKGSTGTYRLGLFMVAAIFGFGAFALLELGRRWREAWHPHAIERSGVFSYRGILSKLTTTP
jgi:MFS transporter, NNP family, nitrate/nitrite transporter